ncbi:GIY-YIG nuclease family protein (plasmid) [Proteus vulgaris]|uniref:GIY-YIG nuclease family protein n=1 Tax=Proteus vulgaris TaxID=585 RepID=UPI00253F927E|nr:GIY-YIG nuclease family protein [Proteus vulgaris]WIF74482.1 GIY-YIG nuclease family protein [Proteus vulgaris]
MMVKNNSYVYVLFYSDINAVKVGKADDVFNRIKQLCHWGKPDFYKSYIIPIPKKEVYSLEASLHLYLKRFKKTMSEHHGYTEFFSIEVLDEIPKLLDFFNLKKEKIIIPSEDDKIKSLMKNKIISMRFKNNIDESISIINEILNTFNNIKRCLYLIRINSIVCDINHKVMIVSSPVLSRIEKKNVGVCGVNIISMSSKDTVYIDIYNIIKIFNRHGCNFIIQSGFNLSFFYSFFLDCYNFLKKDLPNESELPVITLTKENKLVISS